ncbi:MAG: hypothetical protein NTY19_41825 [Planctomycetota bacterium]|nr:hypothetical protein [Planctomycetota bacterium]
MTQRDLDSAVAVATGESPSEIRRLGFGIADPIEVCFDPEPSDVPPAWLDWDQNDTVEPERRVRHDRHVHRRGKHVAV